MTRIERETRAAEVRAMIQKEMSEKRRGWGKRVASFEWELDHLTSGDAANDRRAVMGLAPFANMLDG